MRPLSDVSGIVVEFDDIPDFDDLDYPFLRLVDPYGHTYFSEYQMRAVLPELERFSTTKPSSRLDALIDLARGCASGSHTYLVFHGD